MPRARRRCSKAGCRQFHPCPDHPWGWSSTRTGESQSEPLPANWASLCRAVKARAQGRCEWKTFSVRCWKPGDQTDHIIPRFEWPRGKPGLHDLSNLQLLCSDHHKLKTTEEKKRAIRKRWGKE